MPRIYHERTNEGVVSWYDDIPYVKVLEPTIEESLFRLQGFREQYNNLLADGRSEEWIQDFLIPEILLYNLCNELCIGRCTN